MRQSRMDTDLETMDLDQGGEVGTGAASITVRAGSSFAEVLTSSVFVFPGPRHWPRGKFSTWRTWSLPRGATSWLINAVSFRMDPSVASARATKKCTCLL